MPLNVYPKPGMVVACDFRGYFEPEMIKIRPVVVISPAHMRRPGLVSVVPLSTSAPDPVEVYHYRLIGNPVPGEEASEIWAKCDMVATVCVTRLDRIKIARGVYRVGNISAEQVRLIRCGAAASMGIDFSDPRTYTIGDSR